jgi:hypothetical protein
VNCDVIGFIALDEILGLFFGGVVSVALERDIGNDFLHNSAANSTCFRIPFDVITTLERLDHLSVATESKMHRAKQLLKRYLRCLQHREEYPVLALAFDQF